MCFQRNENKKTAPAYETKEARRCSDDLHFKLLSASSGARTFVVVKGPIFG
jgi:hypothetical protein